MDLPKTPTDQAWNHNSRVASLVTVAACWSPCILLSTYHFYSSHAVDVELPPTVPELSANATLRIATAKERLRVLFAEASAFPRDMDAIRHRWSTMAKENQSDFLKVNLDELWASVKSQSGAITDASDFFKGTQKWEYWFCPQCRTVYLDPQRLIEHVQETHIHGLQQILLQKGIQFCEPIEVDTRQLSGRVRLDQDIFHLSFDNDETMPDSVTFEGEFFKWLTTPAPEVREVSHFSIIQNSVSQGIEILQNLDSLKKARMSKEKVDDHVNQETANDAQVQKMATDLNCLKKRLVNICRIDYHSIILQAMHARFKVVQSPKQVDFKSKKEPVVARDKDNTVGTKFLDFLRNFTLAPGESPYYKGGLKAMVERNSLTFCVYYQHVAKYDKELGNRLCQYLTRVQPMLNNALESFIIEQKLKDECMKISTSDCPQVKILGLPPPGSIHALEDFLGEKNNKVVQRVQIHGNKSIISDTTELGRNLFIGLLEYIFSEHRKGLSWNGTFSMNDLQVKDRIRFEITIKASGHTTREAMANDMKQLANLLFKFYISEGCLPAYFDDLLKSMRDCLQHIETYNSDKTISFRRYLLSHLALKSAMARGHLFLDLYRVRQAIGKDDNRVLTYLLTSNSFTTDWSNPVSKHPMLQEVYKSGIREADGSLKKKPYDNNLDHLLIFIRHAAEHGPDHTKDNDHEQTLKSLIENDLIISNHLQFHILKLIKTLLDKYKMKDDIFSDVWSHFSESK